MIIDAEQNKRWNETTELQLILGADERRDIRAATERRWYAVFAATAALMTACIALQFVAVDNCDTKRNAMNILIALSCGLGGFAFGKRAKDDS